MLVSLAPLDTNMRHQIVCAALLMAPAFSGLAEPSRQPAKGSMECQVWLRELSFARSFADRDVDAFAKHLHPHAVFGLSLPVPTRGPEAIVAEWTPLIEGDDLRLFWYPTHVNFAQGTQLATSSGPVLTERPNAKGNRWMVSRYSTVWERGADGVWRVLFDDGTAPRSATDEDIAKFHAERQATCR